MKQGVQIERYIRFCLYLVAIILINWVGNSLFLRFDLTKNKIYSLSPISKNAVKELSEPLTIKAFFSKNLPPPYNNISQYVHDLLDEYALYSNKNFNYQVVTLSADRADLEKQAKGYGLHPLQVQVIQKDQLKYQQAYMGLVILHGDALEKLPAITSTDNLEYQLTSAILKLKNKVSALLALKGKIEIRLYLSSSLLNIAPKLGLNGLASLKEKVRKVVDELNQTNYDKLSFVFLDPSHNFQARKEARKFALQELQWPALPQENIQAGTGLIGMALTYQDKKETISLLKVLRIPIFGTQYKLINLNELKDLIDQNIQRLIGINQTIGYLADHGTPALFPYGQQGNNKSIQSFKALVERHYTLKPIHLKEGIPAGLGCLVINGPTEKFSDYELYQIDQALMQGTNLAIFLDGFKEMRPQQGPYNPQGPVFLPNKTGLEKLLGSYGLKLKQAIVLDTNCYQQQLNQGGRLQGERPIYFAPIIKNQNINHTLPFLKNIKGLIGFKLSPVQPLDKIIKDNKLQANRLFRSSEKSWIMEKNINLNPMFIHPPNDNSTFASYDLGYLVQGRFKSHFAGQPIPESALSTNSTDGKTGQNRTQKKTKQDILKAQVRAKGSKLDQGRPAKVILVGSSDMLSDALMDRNGNTPNAVLILNLLDELNNQGEMAELRSKTQAFNPLRETNEEIKRNVKLLNIIGLPVLTLLCGLLVFACRRNRQKKIALLFSSKT